MMSESKPQGNWFDWAESHLAEWKARDAEWAESFTLDGTRVLAGASRAARSLDQDYVGAEHLLAGILKFGSGIGAAALKDAGLSLAVLKEAIESARGPFSRKQVEGTIPYTPRCKGIIGRARIRAHDRGGRVDVEDLLQELLAEKGGLPADIFRQRAIDTERIRTAIEANSHSR